MTKCANSYCQDERWHGPNGTNESLTLCEFHQREAWRNYKQANKQSRKKSEPKQPRPKKVKPVKEKAAPKPLTKANRCLLYDPVTGKLQRVEIRVIKDMPIQTHNTIDLIALYRAMGISTIYALGDVGMDVDNIELVETFDARLRELKARRS